MTFILGLTGSIGMGKSTVASQFKALGVPVVDADAIVHALLAPKGAAFAAVAQAFPEVVKKGIIDRQHLGKTVFADASQLKRLEAILHPLVRQRLKETIRQARYQRRLLLVLEIPLLFEIHAEVLCDAVVVVTAPAFIQRQRVLARPGMSETKFKQIVAQQVPDREKRHRADAVISTGLGKAASWRQVKTLLNQLRTANVCIAQAARL